MEQKEVEMNDSQSGKSIQTQLMEKSLEGLGSVENGQLVDGKVIQVTDEYVFVDIGYKSEGKVPVREFIGGLPSVGDTVPVVVVRLDGRNGPEVSKSKADAKQLWKVLRQAFEEKQAVDGVIEKEVKGGFDVNLGGDIHAFLPVSQSDIQRVEDPSKLIGLNAKFYVERIYTDSKANVVVNRRKYLEELVDENREKFFAETQIGDVVKGTVKSFTNFGAFIDLGGFDGLLHVNDMSWGHATSPKEFVKKGQEIELKVIRLVPEEKRINLSLKHFTEDPWIHFAEKYHMNDIVDGVVTKLTDFGAFIELEEGIEGLAHVSEFSWTKRVSKPSDVVKIGDKIKCMVLGYDIQAGRVSLGLKQVTDNPWDSIADKYPVGTKLTGSVVKITSNGAFIQLEEGIDGFLHAEDISWTKKIKHAGSVLKVGDEVEVVVLDVDSEEKRITVGMKQTVDNPWKQFAQNYSVGSSFEGEITKIAEFGIFVKSPDGIEGLVNKANLTDDRSLPYEEVVSKYKVGDKVSVSVVDINVERERVAFSIKEFKKAQERKEMSQYMASVSDDDDAYTFGDLMKSQQNKN
jgi:small subunit ribosomal protein S1